MVGKKQEVTTIFRAWFSLTRQEQLLLSAVLAIILVGVTARYFHLKNEKPEPYDPEGIGLVTDGDTR